MRGKAHRGRASLDNSLNPIIIDLSIPGFADFLPEETHQNPVLPEPGTSRARSFERIKQQWQMNFYNRVHVDSPISGECRDRYMQIIFQFSISPAQKQLLALSEHWEVLQKSATLGNAMVALEWPSEKTKSIIRTISREEINLWNAWMLFGKNELNKYSFFELVTSQVVNISRSDNKLFDAAFSSDATISKTRSHKIPSRIIASTIKLNENSIASYGGFSSELITSSYVVSILSKSDLKGWFLQDVFKRDGTAHALHKRLNSKNIVEVVSFDVSVRKLMRGLSETTLSMLTESALKYDGHSGDDNSIRNRLIAQFGGRQETDSFRYFGCKTLKPEDIYQVEDFSRLGDSERQYMMAGWVVSQKARAVILENKLKGIKFKPVIMSGSEFHKTYLDLWNGAVSFLSEHGVTYQHDPLKL